MRPEIPIPNLDHLVQLYQSGISAKKIAEDIGMYPPVLLRRFRTLGIPIRGRAEARRLKTEIPIEMQKSLFQRYDKGESVPDLAASTGLTLEQIYNLFRRNNIKRRTQSSAKKLLFSRMPPEKRAEHSARWARCRRTSGVKHSDAEREALALTRFRRQTHKGIGEDDVATRLRNAGYEVLQQFPVGPYNVDIALCSHCIAVEIERPKSPAHGAAASIRKRTEYLIDRGWTVLFAFLSDASKYAVLDSATVAQDVIAVAKILGSNESPRGQYGVIGGNRKSSPGLRANLDGLPVIECP